MITLSENSIPRHVGIIMDGNGRWAEKRALGRLLGHRKGVENVRGCIEYAKEQGIKSLTLYAFSTENWKRPDSEVSGIMELAVEFLAKETPEMKANGVRLKFIGERGPVPPKTIRSIEASERETRECESLMVNIALNYGGRAEIARACRLLAEKAASGEIKAGDITESSISEMLYCPESADCDLIIRTGAEARVSNFLLWQLAYSEIYFTDTLWPDFDKEAFNEALAFYQGRSRRFGGLK